MESVHRFFNRLSDGKLLLLLTGFALLLSFYHLSGRFLFSGDETRVAGIIRGMLLRDPWFLPTLNGTPFLEYPPLHYWGGALFMALFGIGNGSAKAMSAAALCASIPLVYALARRLGFAKAAAFLVGIMLGFSISFFLTGRTCMVDATLSFFVLLAVFGFYSGLTALKTRDRLLYYLLYSAGAGCAVMTKGLLGLALPGAIGFFTLFFRDLVERKFHWRNWLELGCYSLAALIPAAVWAMKLYLWLGHHDFCEVMYSNNIGRFTGSQTDHAAPFYYYLARLPQLFQPWLVFLPFGLWTVWRKFRRNHPLSALFLLCMFLAPMLLFTLASGKRQVYLLPVYPAAVLLEAQGVLFLLESLRKRIPEETLIRRLPIAAAVFLSLTGAAGIILALLYPETAGWAILPILTAGAGVLLFRYGRNAAGGLALLFALALFIPFVEGTLANECSQDQNLEPLFQKVKKQERLGKKVYLLEPVERTSGAAVFYLGKCLPVRKRARYDGKSQEIWVFRKRDKKNKSRYGDHHHMVQMPEGTEL